MSRISLDKSRIAIVLLEGIHESAAAAFRADGYSNIQCRREAPGEAALAACLADAYIVGIRSATQLNERVFERAGKLMAVGCFCIGTNQVDLAAAQRRGVPVFHAPFSNTRSVAELVTGETILLLRGVPLRNAQAHRGEWVKSAGGAHEVRGKTLGIVGYGHIGTQVGLLAEALGMKVLFYDIVTKLALGNARPAGSLDALLEASDVVTLHVPETPGTRGMIAAPQLERMKPGAALVNASRGSVVDIGALACALKTGHLSGAAVDVFPSEPRHDTAEFQTPLREFDNVLLTPHIAGSTEEAQESIGVEVAEKLIRYSNNGSTLTSVNFPEVALPEHPGQQRLLHIHRNQPGVLSAINAVFSESRINIAAQYLQTNPNIGYVVIDVETDAHGLARQLRAKLEEVPGTIRTRILY